MTTRLPDPRGSRAVLIGTSRYDSDLPDLLAVRNNLEVLQELLTSDASGGFPRERCEVVQDAPDPRAVCATIREAAMTATDTLLVYFSGHGVLNDDLTLHLALTGTDESDLRWTSIPFEAIREILEASPCPNKILILDCCNSGRVLDTLMGNGPEPPATLTIRGTYILTSSANAPSYAPVGERYTAFTGEFIRLLRDGLPGGPDLLTLSALYDPLTKSLTRRGYPQPRQQSSDGHARLGLVRNRRAVAPAEAEGDGEDEGERARGGEVRFGASRVFHRVRNWSVGIPVSVALFAVAATHMPSEKEPLILTDPRHVTGLLALLGWIALLAALGRWNPADYSLVLSSDGVEVQYKSEHFSYPWHRIGRCWIRQRPATRLRGPRYELMVRPMPGVFPQTASWRSAGPQQDDTEGTLRFVDLRRLATTPEAVESALAGYAGEAWTPSPDLVVRRPRVPKGEEVFAVDRRLLVAVAVLCAVLGGRWFPYEVFTRPAEILTMPVSLALSALLFGTAWFAVARLVRPVRLVVGAAGLTLTRGAAEIAYAWTEIEKVGVVYWPRGARHLGLLAVRPTEMQERAGPAHMSARKLTQGAVALCLLQEVTHDPRRLEDALARFADEEQLALPQEAWLRTPGATPAQPGFGLTLRGLQPARVSALVCVAFLAPFAIGVQVEDAFPRASDWTTLSRDLLLRPLFVFGPLAYFLTGRHHVSLHISSSGLTLRAFGSHQLHIPWGDVDRIGVVARLDTDEHTLVLWPRHGATIPRSLWLPMRKSHGGLRLLTLETHRVEISPEALDQAIARYAGRRHTHMAQLRQSARKKN
ncbi:caspase family protein [Streptomyces sp. AC495_CC817]|uniref:caspase, EACC1-associated type n=1 Tax=Streptomyces sp. AC495_CC817 TaxID=2823900 RepID=UPI001C26E74E|nr:caspase family protein [Streptomyces sp. AC495_CC817]